MKSGKSSDFLIWWHVALEPTLPIPNRVLKRSRANDTYFIGKVGSRQIKEPEMN